jgi:predicted transcriptional regulator
MSAGERLVIRQVAKPSKDTIDEFVNWFCKVFNLSESKSSAEPKMLRIIANRSFSYEGITSKELHKLLSMPRSTTIYHLNRFISSGIVVRKGRKYYLRSENMEDTIGELQDDMLREFNRMMDFAEKFDKLVESEVYGREKKLK